MWRHPTVISNKVLHYATRHFCRVDVGHVTDINSTREYLSKRDKEREIRERGVGEGIKARKSDILTCYLTEKCVSFAVEEYGESCFGHR